MQREQDYYDRSILIPCDDVEAPRFQSRIKKGDIDEKASYF